ncbi:blr7681 [Bradyrhizobium diazoefficiens USDA 110]|uniref:Blr7681 protein n=2 Tax=Nitrobacteraceae TaxID=41294 RepID=Q89CW4_BRADU|nr:hypothetical protein AAV28_36120 [Bradyrhizobium diazoefficiens USDA 110]QBP26420.1 hypothetical protein Bdiaspc4_40590 [Bradyrhizobium diazoefficiens]BAC52946.1 blr7681 [Bradyrhizobium diazoefficiens USDA 110]
MIGIDYWRTEWSTFHYNLGWSRWVRFLDGWIAKCAMAVPVVGYLVLFNDGVSQHISFNDLASEHQLSVLSLTASGRLKLIYFGLIILGSANILYRLRRPYIFRVGTDQFDYVERALVHFTVDNYIDLNGVIRHEGHRTLHGKYDDAEFDSFVDAATGRNNPDVGNWNLAKSKFEGLLRSILIETFFRNDVKHRLALTCFLLLAFCGYGLLLIPSFDLFVKVIRVTIRGVT